ncbi:hypothetical protein BDV96DRAFT_330725 [Lophiotrema nucula]|uniref:Caspase domain-containing protein n=1 Tax=Lophiotrema nucula TaxID=690887 RepID=A0A6A5YHP7_9PLEO|nr:hypothetical protein BDV96DRAFT_330725 [Lophiotrema nucula]
MEHRRNKGLLIVVYVGVGSTHKDDSRERDDRRGIFIYSADSHCEGDRIDWGQQQKVLENSPFNTLVILDTCSSGSAFRQATHEGPGSLEFLIACGFSGETPAGLHSFSAVLCSTLEDMAAASFTISGLYERLLRNTTLYETLFYARLPNDGPEIKLQAMTAKVPWTDRSLIVHVQS